MAKKKAAPKKSKRKSDEAESSAKKTAPRKGRRKQSSEEIKAKKPKQNSDKVSASDETTKDEDPHRHECVVVGIGASAGGLDAYKQFLQKMPDDSGLAFVLVQHLDPTHESLMVELLSKYTSMPVLQVENATPIEPNHVYMIPPKHFIRIKDQGLFLEEPITKRGVRLPIDYFFQSLAEARQERAICVVLSGTGSDGADGIREIKAQGGMTIVQQPDSAEYDGMPRAAIGTGSVDFILSIGEMAEVIIPYAKHPYVQSQPNVTLAESSPDHFRAIISLLRAYTDQDFTHYKKGTLTRRIERRMGIHHIDRPTEYLKLLRGDSQELQSLFRDLLIGVTRFFRDEVAWQDLSDLLTPVILEKREEEPFRVWVPGCSSGEEAYSIAMLLYDQQERQNRRLDVQVFATDIDSAAIDVARLGIYPENIAKDIPESYLDHYFQREGEKLRVRKKVRESCIFAVQNVLSDPPFSNLDVICCRNLLIYLESDVQRRVFDMLHFALKPSGLLFLGSSESPGKRKHLFEVASQSSRIYRKIGESKPGHAFPLSTQTKTGISEETISKRETAPVKSVGTVELSKRALLEQFAPASVVVNQRGLIQYIHGPIRNYLDFPSGEPDLDLGTMALSGLKARTRSALQQARTEEETISLLAPRVSRNGGHVAVRVRVQPLPTVKGSEPLFLVSFLDEVPAGESNATDEKADNEDSTTQEEDRDNTPLDQQLALELQATREDLQSTIEELESANEELKASNEEVMSMNEELQSTNEELETSREELQSLNEELSTLNNQLHDKVGELEETNNDLTNLLTSTDMATLFLDNDLRIRRFTPATVRLMSLLDSDVGRPISDLSPRVKDPDLESDAKKVLRDLAPVEQEVSNGGNRSYIRRITPFRTSENKIDGVVVTFSDVTSLTEAAERVELRERQQAVIAKLGRNALTSDSLQSLLERTTEAVAQTLNVEYSKVLRLSRNKKNLRLLAGFGWQKGLIGKMSVRSGIDSQAGYTLQSATPIIVKDLPKEKRFSGPQLLIDHDVVSGMSVIIGPEEQPWGVLGVHSKRQVNFTVDDTNFIQAIANLLWDAIARESTEHRFRALIEASAQIVWTTNSAGEVIEDSPTWRNFTGQTFEEWRGYGWLDVIHPDDRDRVEQKWREAVESKQSINIEYRVKHVSGEYRWTQVNALPLVEFDESIRGWVGMHTDISEHKALLSELEEARQHAEAANEAKSIFLANMSHEIRTPLTAILGYADVLRARIEDSDAKACVRTIKENGDYLCELLNDILDLAKIESGKVTIRREKCSLVTILADIRSLMTVRATEKSLTLSIEFDGEIPDFIETDPKLVRQVLVNLVGNAIKFTDQGSVKIIARCVGDCDQMGISVIDTGIGITAEDVDNLFIPFEQVDNSYTRKTGGSGLGLSISKHLVDMLGGEISVESEVDQGSKFSFTFATGSINHAEWITPDPADLHVEVQETEPEELPQISGRILLADDRREVRFLVREFIQAQGGQVETVENGEQALTAFEKAEQNGGAFDAILLDVQMPVMDGMETATELRNEGYQGPLIAVTANVMQQDRESCLNAGCDAVVGKPIERAELVTTLAKLLAGQKRQNDDKLAVLCIDDHEDTCHAREIMLTDGGFVVQTAQSSEAALHVVESFTPDVVLIDLGLPDLSGGELLQQLKTKPTLAHCAFICVTGQSEDDINWREMGFHRFIQKPADSDFEHLASVIRQAKE